MGPGLTQRPPHRLGSHSQTERSPCPLLSPPIVRGQGTELRWLPPHASPPKSLGESPGLSSPVPNAQNCSERHSKESWSCKIGGVLAGSLHHSNGIQSARFPLCSPLGRSPKQMTLPSTPRSHLHISPSEPHGKGCRYYKLLIDIFPLHLRKK